MLDLIQTIIVDTTGDARTTYMTENFKLVHQEHEYAIIEAGGFRFPVQYPVDQDSLEEWAMSVWDWMKKYGRLSVCQPEDKSLEEYPHQDCYKRPTPIQEWETCRYCGRKPYAWVYDRGSFVRCNCPSGPHSENTDFNKICVESINSYVNRVGTLAGYDDHGLKKAWNAWATHGIYCQEHMDVRARLDGRY